MQRKRVVVTGSIVVGLDLVPRLPAAGAEVRVGDLKPRPKSFGACIPDYRP